MRDQNPITTRRARPRSGAEDRGVMRMVLHEALSRSRQHRAE